MDTLGTANHTPWDSPREVEEKDLSNMIESMTSQVKDMNGAIFNIHVPLIDSIIDRAPKLDSTLKPVMAGGQMVMISAGSTATRASIKKHQPLIGIHGHFHESKGTVKIGKTVSFNPGSEHAEGTLRGLLFELEDLKIKSHVFISGWQRRQRSLGWTF